MANIIQIKRTSTAGRTPNTTNSANSQYIAAGELALNMADCVLYTSNGSSLIMIGSSQQTFSSNTISAFSISTDSVNTTSLAASTGTFDNISTDQGISIGNSTVNASVNSTTLFAGNGSVNTFVKTTFIAVSNTSANMQISPLTLFTGNSTANLFIDMAGGTISLSIAAASLDATGTATVQTTTNHNLTLTPGLTVNISGSSAQVFNSSNYTKSFSVTSLPTSNTIKFTITSSSSTQTPSSFKTNARKLLKIGRSNGVATVVTSNTHLFSNGDSIFINDTILVNGKLPAYSFNVPSASPATITTINSTAFTYTSQSPTSAINLAGKTYLITPAIAKTATGNVFLRITANNSFTVGSTIKFNTMVPNVIAWSSTRTTISNASFLVTESNTTSFTLKLGYHTAGTPSVVNTSATFTSGSIGTSYDEAIGNVTSTSYVNQIIANTSVGGSLGSQVPVGVTIQTGNGQLMKITSSFIYVGPSSNLNSGTLISGNQIRPGTV